MSTSESKRSKIQEAIDQSPREHAPAPYEVMMYNIKGNKESYIGTSYVRASSERRAKLTALREVAGWRYKRPRAGSAKRIGG